MSLILKAAAFLFKHTDEQSDGRTEGQRDRECGSRLASFLSMSSLAPPPPPPPVPSRELSACYARTAQA